MTRPFVRALLLLTLLSVALTGCHRHRGRYPTAVATTGGAQPITVSHRHYRNLLRTASRDMSCRGDQLVPQEVSPGIFSIQGCGLLRDYAMLCRGRHRCQWISIQPVEQVAVAETQCASGQVQLTVTGPLARNVVACGQSLDYALACGPAGCGWTRGAPSTSMMMQTEPGTSVIIVAEDPGAPGAAPQAAPASEDTVAIEQVGVADSLQAVFANQIAAVRACTGGQPVTVRVIWDAAGTVTVALAGAQSGTPMEACVRQAIGPFVLQGVTAPGEVQAGM